MSAHPEAGISLADTSPARRLLAELNRLHPLVIVTDARGHIEAVSEAWLARCGRHREYLGRDLREQIPKQPRPEQSIAILSEIRTRGFLPHAQVEVLDEFDQPLAIELCIFPVSLEPESQPHQAVIARLAGQRPNPDRHPIVEASPEALLSIDAQGYVDYANPAVEQVLGIPRSQIEKRPISFFATTRRDLFRLLDAVAARRPDTLEISFRSGDGSDSRVELNIQPQGDESQGDESSGGTVLAMRRPLDRGSAQTEISRRNEELEHCINTLAHDLRSPLVALLGFSRLLRQDYGERLDDTGSHFIDRIEQAGRTMESLIHDLLELSRIGQPGERLSMVDPRAVLLQLAAECKPRLDERSIRLELPENPPLLYCDRTRLYQVFSNLIGNAIEHMGDSAERRIVVAVEEDSGGHRVSVRDFGCGIPEDEHDRIFQAFQSLNRRSETATGSSSGTGMGLAIVRRIAETHGGRAWVESSEGEGARFHVVFPRH